MNMNVLVEFVKQKLKEKEIELTNEQIDILSRVIDGQPHEIIVFKSKYYNNDVNKIYKEISNICTILSKHIYSGSEVEKDIKNNKIKQPSKRTTTDDYKVTRQNVKYILEELYKKEYDIINSENRFSKSFLDSWKKIITEIAEDLYLFNLPNSKIHSNLFIHRKLNRLGFPLEPKSVNQIIDSFIEDNNRPFKAFIYGCSGLGKTSLLKRITWDYIQEDKKDYLPILISLRRFSNQQKDLYTYISEIFAKVEVYQSQLRQILQTEKVLILLDCLSAGQEENQNTIDQIEKFVSTFNKCSYIISSNVQSHYIEGFEQYQLNSFEERDINHFISQWLINKGIPNMKEAQSLAKNLQKTIQNLPIGDYKDLAGIPLYLSLFCQVFYEEQNIDHFQKLEKPQTEKILQIYLYSKAISSLLIWDDTRQIETTYYKELIEENRAFDLFSFLAFEILFDKKTSNGYVKKDRIQELIKKFILSYSNYKNYSDIHCGKILEEIEVQDGILIQKHFGDYGFIHTSILYFFAASYLIKPNLNIPIPEENHPNNDKWEKVIEMAHDILDYYKFELKHKSSRLVNLLP